ncbi:MAG: DNA-binding protein [Candidatus Berkelbacteria bacterium]|nr:DNA-binding protein [Candidatus Berkelbacteria bacterium]
MKISRLKRGDEVVSSLNRIVEKMEGGLVLGIGALDSARLKIYNLETKTYLEKEFTGPLEVAGFMAIIAKNPEGKSELHPHITVCDTNFNSSGGHLAEAQVGATFEYAILESDEEISRYHDAEIGLNLIKEGDNE